jgi:hypothetical protein
MSEPTGKAVSLQELPDLRRKTEAVSRFLKEQITAHLETLRPMFAPDRILGKYAGAKVESPGSDRAWSDLQQSYRAFTAKPFDLPETLDQQWLALVGNVLELHPWEYVHAIQGKPITMTSPVCWAVNYRTNYSLANVKNVLAGNEAVRLDYMRQFVVNTLVLQVALNRSPGLTKLFQDLRYELKIETHPELKKLPVLTISSCLTTFRPADDLITAATAFSGVPAFIELLDTDAIGRRADSFQTKVEELLK